VCERYVRAYTRDRRNNKYTVTGDTSYPPATSHHQPPKEARYQQRPHHHQYGTMRLLLLVVQRGLQWYTKKLQTHPYSTNASAAVVLMTVGDVTAQTIEQQQQTTTRTRERNSASTESITSGCSSPMLSETKKNDTSTSTRPTTSTTMIDWVRTGTMVVWAGAFYAPFFVFLYRRIFDRYLPIGGLVGIGGRVLLSLVVSVPVNATFYVYGSVAHHGLSYLAADQHYPGHNNNFGGGGDSMSRGNGDVPYHDSPQQQQEDSNNTHQQRLLPRSLSFLSWLEPAMMMAHRKIRAELSDTVQTSACVWVPLNGVNFSIVPPVYRPLVVMAGSAGWNAYLSIAQYRVVP
jgi:Mpv17 / PMP22 family